MILESFYPYSFQVADRIRIVRKCAERYVVSGTGKPLDPPEKQGQMNMEESPFMSCELQYRRSLIATINPLFWTSENISI